MAVNADVRITVLKRSRNEDFLESYADSMWEPCERLSEGQEFISKNCNIHTKSLLRLQRKRVMRSTYQLKPPRG